MSFFGGIGKRLQKRKRINTQARQAAERSEFFDRPPGMPERQAGKMRRTIFRQEKKRLKGQPKP